MTKLLQVLNLTGFVLVIVMNYLANALPINGYNTGELSGFYPNYFTPAGITFAIWGVIYLLLLGFVLFQAKDWVRAGSSPIPEVQEIGYWFFISCLANAGWILAWHHRMIGLSVGVMLVLLISLLVIYLRLDIALTRVPALTRWLVNVPFSLYLGWISVATIANVTAFLVDSGWQGGGIPEPIWAAIMVGVAAFLSLGMMWVRKDIAYGVVILWALTGVLLAELGREVPSSSLRFVLYLALGLVVLGIGGAIFRKN